MHSNASAKFKAWRSEGKVEGKKRAEIVDRTKQNSPLKDQEAECLRVVAGARPLNLEQLNPIVIDVGQ
jgi:hypothetical protein